MERSKDFYMRLYGDYALFTAPESKGGGERISYSVPTQQALHGIVDACYFKPTIRNCVEEVKVIHPIRSHTFGVRALYNNGKPGLNYVTALENVEYLVKFHFEWNSARPDLAGDRNMKKHEAIVERSLRRGGRKDVFLGAREFVGNIEALDEASYNEAQSFYDGQTIHFGIMFQCFEYPEESGGALQSYFAPIVMENGIIHWKPKEECPIHNTLSGYTFRTADAVKSAEEEWNAMTAIFKEGRL